MQHDCRAQPVSTCATLPDVNTRIARLAAAVAVVGALTAVVATGCGDDAAPTAGSSSGITTEVLDTTSVVAATAVPTAAVSTAAAPATAEVAPAGWQPVAEMPSLAYIPCCGSNYSGDSSPEIPTDATEAFAPGIYRAVRKQPADDAPVETSSITFSVAAFVACATPGILCEDGFVDGDVGVGPVVREVAMPLDEDLRVVVGGFACADDGSNYDTVHQAATGVEFAALQAELDAAYASEVQALDENQTGFEEYPTLFAEPRGGFSVPCLMAGVLQFEGTAGPTILLQTLGAWDADGIEIVPSRSISISVVHLTALEVAADGSQTLYFYAGFLS